MTIRRLIIDKSALEYEPNKYTMLEYLKNISNDSKVFIACKVLDIGTTSSVVEIQTVGNDIFVDTKKDDIIIDSDRSMNIVIESTGDTIWIA